MGDALTEVQRLAVGAARCAGEEVSDRLVFPGGCQSVDFTPEDILIYQYNFGAEGIEPFQAVLKLPGG